MTERRETRQRQLVLETVRAHHDHPSADTIYLEARSMDPKISRGTVYRNLNNLSEEEEITHVKVPGSADRFDLRTDRHYHLQCVICGAVIDAPVDYRPDVDSEMAEKTGFQVIRHQTVFEGICPDCLARQQAKEASQAAP